MIHFYNFRYLLFYRYSQITTARFRLRLAIALDTQNTLLSNHTLTPIEQLNIGSICILYIRNKREEKYKTKNKEDI